MIEWLTTIPGILVVCGVILLVIAIILFIVGAKKSRSEEVINNNQPIENNFNNMSNDMVNVAVAATSEPVVSETETVTVNEAEPVSIVSNFETPVVEPQFTIEEPVVTNEEVVSVPEVQEQPVVDAPVYGGEAPRIDFTIEEEKPVTIYGGNDPLEATQTFPTMEENHVPYGGSFPEVKINEPTVDTVVPTVSEETVEMPVIEPVVTTEEVVSVPEVQEQTFEPVSEPVVESVTPTPVEVPTFEMPAVEPVGEPVVESVAPTPVEVPVVEMPTFEPVNNVTEPEVVNVATDDVNVVEVASNVEEL